MGETGTLHALHAAFVRAPVEANQRLTFAQSCSIMTMSEGGEQMPDLDEIRVAVGVGETIRRVVKENTIELLRDTESDAVVALVPLDRLQQLLGEANPKLGAIVARLRQLAAEEHERDRQARALAGRLATREEERRARQGLPWEAVKADPAWQQQWDTLLAEVRSHVPPDLTPDEIEAEVEAAREAIPPKRRARRS
jgi:hypothetical protein